MDGKDAPRDLDHRLAALAGRQYGVVALTQLRGLGFRRGCIEHRLRTGRLHRLHRGVYAVGHLSLSRHAHWLAAVLTLGPGAVLSHRTAAALWGILETAAVVEVTVPSRAGRARRRGIVIHRVNPLADADTARREGIPVTGVARTLLDLAAVLPRRGIERAIDESQYQGLFDLSALEAGLERHRGRSGCGRLRAVLAGHQAGSTVTRSFLEERFLAICIAHDLGHPLVNARVHGFVVDFLWADRRTIVEVDGRRGHSTWGALERDRARDASLGANGYVVQRFTFRQIIETPEWVAALVRRALAQGGSPTRRAGRDFR